MQQRVTAGIQESEQIKPKWKPEAQWGWGSRGCPCPKGVICWVCAPWAAPDHGYKLETQIPSVCSAGILASIYLKHTLGRKGWVGDGEGEEGCLLFVFTNEAP